MTELAKRDRRILVYFTAVAFLHVACKIARIGFAEELMDVLATTSAHFVSTHRHPSQCYSELSLSKAAKMMKVVANNSRSTMQLIQIELSKAYLRRALIGRFTDSGSDSIYCLANVYLAVLYYTTGQYQMAIDHCTLVIRSQDHSQCSSHVVQGELLPKIDDDIDTVLGLAVFYQYIRTAVLNQRQTQHVSIFTTELFAHYLNIRCLSVMLMLSIHDVHRLINYAKNSQLFTVDILLVQSIIHNFYCQPTTLYYHQQPTLSATNLNTSELIELLQKSAVEHLTIFRQLEARDFGSVATIVITDFEALYAYKHGDYQRCLLLSKQNEHTLRYGIDLPRYITTVPEFCQLLNDDDIVSVIALTMIVNPNCSKWSHSASISQLTLSLYLMTQCQLKLRHSVMSLARTLDCIEVAQGRHSSEMIIDQLTLQLMKCKVLMHCSW